MGKKYYFDKPENVRKVLRGLYVVAAFLVVIDFFVPKHPSFPWEGYPAFYGVYGFVACVFLVLAAKHLLRRAVKRDERYYDE